MCMFSGKCSMLVLVIVGVIVMLGFMVMLEVCVEGFIDDLILIGGIYYWQCECDCKMLLMVINIKLIFFILSGMLILIFSLVMLLICLVLILLCLW